MVRSEAVGSGVRRRRPVQLAMKRVTRVASLPDVGSEHEPGLLRAGGLPGAPAVRPLSVPGRQRLARGGPGFLDERFGDGAGQVREGVYHPLKAPLEDGSWHSPRKVAFWRDCKVNVEFLLGRSGEPGVDYAMTKDVHCKSRSEAGVRKATRTCTARWLEQVLALSPAPVLVVVGQVAADAVSQQYGLTLPIWKVTQAVVGGRID